MDGPQLLELGLLFDCEAKRVFDEWVYTSLHQVVDYSDVPPVQGGHHRRAVEFTGPAAQIGTM